VKLGNNHRLYSVSSDTFTKQKQNIGAFDGVCYVSLSLMLCI